MYSISQRLFLFIIFPFLFRSSLEETYSKQLGKLAKQCGASTSIAAAASATSNTNNGAPNIGPLCTFTPLWQLLKTSCEKVAQLQLQMAQKLNDMVKDVGKYSEELARKHKVVKESESNTVEAIQVIYNSYTKSFLMK